ncbi:MAG: FMN-binding protein [Deltaproteobacteria bacterium]|jgi:major membrane immunogen (membrane-anchored lipoprotein)|nr:FMN-binding protein [Deltaproteobacteria bacterium]
MAITALVLVSVLFFFGCKSNTNVLKDGYFTAMSSDFNKDGWKDYLTIYVNNGQITTAEYNAFNETGLLRSWDTDYLKSLYKPGFQSPNHYPRQYCSYLVALQDPSRVQTIDGGRKTHQIFVILAQAALDHSRLGANTIAEVELPETFAYPNDI